MEEFNINIHSRVFGDLLENINKSIIKCLNECYEGKFQGGEIAVKLNVEVLEDCKTYQKVDESGKITNFTYDFKRPVFEHEVALTLKERHETQGKFNERMLELKCGEDNNFYLESVKEPQMNIDEIL